MDSLITAAAHSLAAGDPLHALKRVALRDDPPALALRGIAMAQLGDLMKAKELLKRAAAAFGTRDPVSRSRCTIAEAEVALVSRDLGWPAKALETARGVLEKSGDRLNAAHAGCLIARRLLLIGKVEEAARVLAGIDAAVLPPALRASHEIAVAGIAIRRIKTAAAATALENAAQAASAAGIASLAAEVAELSAVLSGPAARTVSRGVTRTATLADVEAIFASGVLVVDACRTVVRQGTKARPLASRPVLFALARALAEGWPEDVARDDLLRRAFGARHADESHRARLRVEIGRLRAEIAGLAEVTATAAGFALQPVGTGQVIVLAPISEDRHQDVLALLADGEAWASSALAIALDVSARTVQRALDDLAAEGKVQSVGRGRARRWLMPPLPSFPTTLLLPGPLPAL